MSVVDAVMVDVEIARLSGLLAGSTSRARARALVARIARLHVALSAAGY